MSGDQSYLVRLLRKTEAALVARRRQHAGTMVARIIDRLSKADDVSDALGVLYSVQGFDLLALRLMWILERREKERNGQATEVMEHEAEGLATVVDGCINGKQEETLVELPEIHATTLDAFYEALHRFGRSVQELRRRSFDGDTFRRADTEALYRILSEAASLKEVAVRDGKRDVEHFAEALSGFVQHAIDADRTSDVRVVNVLDNANLTLQTVLEAAGAEDYDSLQQTIELLQRPQDLLDAARDRKG